MGYDRTLVILEVKLQELVADGELSEKDDQLIEKMAGLLDLNTSDIEEIEKKAFFREFSVIQRRAEQSLVLTDQDCYEIEAIKKKYGVKNLVMEGNADMFRKIYLVEEKGQLPAPIAPDLMLDANETAFFNVRSTWHQARVHNHGYSGMSISVPTGLRGVKLRFGQYSAVKSDEITPLASGSLWVTSKRLLFHGDSRNTKVDHKKIIDLHIYLDSLKVEKTTGKPDYFSMGPVEARYISALIGALRV